MKCFNLASGSLAVVLAWAGVAQAQSNLNAFSGIPTPPPNPTPYNGTTGGYVVGPSLPGSGGSYSYVQQNVGRSLGMSPNAYYSMNYFTSAPMNPTSPYAYSSGYVNPTTTYPAGSYPTQTTPTYSYGAAPYTTTTQTTPAYTYGAAPYTSGSYANANNAYYQTRRGGPLRRIFNRR